jgi:hypothetical protein
LSNSIRSSNGGDAEEDLLLHLAVLVGQDGVAAEETRDGRLAHQVHLSAPAARSAEKLETGPPKLLVARAAVT